MAVEYLYDCIRATVGDDMTIEAEINDDEGNPITEECRFRIYDNDNNIIEIVEGEYSAEDSMWSFVVPIAGLGAGSYYYTVCHKGTNICFKKPLYLI